MQLKTFHRQLFLWILLGIGCGDLWAVPSASTPLMVMHFPASLPANETHPLWSYQGQQVQVRGFWYPLSPERSILAPAPNLKSCCVGKPATIRQQLVVQKNFETLFAGQAVTLEGMFKMEPVYDQDKDLIQFYVLEQPQIVVNQPSFKFSILLTLAAFLGGAYYFWHVKSSIASKE